MSKCKVIKHTYRRSTEGELSLIYNTKLVLLRYAYFSSFSYSAEKKEKYLQVLWNFSTNFKPRFKKEISETEKC